MKKRLLILFVMLFSVFGVVACAEVTITTSPVDVTEQVAAPQNLSIAGKILSWSAVTGVSQYQVYADGVLVSTVNTTSYNFTSLTGNGIVFQVVAVGPQGYDNSPMSASVAYIADPAAEIAAITAAMEDMDMDMPTEFVAELVRKGVTGDDFEANVTALQTFMEDMGGSSGDVVALNTALTTLVAAVDNYEAYISAFILMLPDMIDQQIESLNEDLVYYEDWLTDDPTNEYVQSQIANIEDQIVMMGDLKSAIMDNEEQMVVTVVTVAEYLLALQDQITNELLTNIQALAESQTAPTSADIMAVKDEIVNLLLDNLPSADDLTLVFEMLAIFENAMTGSVSTTNADLANEYGNATHIFIEIVVRFFDSIDAAWLDEMLALDSTAVSGEQASVEMAILFIKAFASFQDDNTALFDAMDAVFTEAQKAALFEANIASIGTILIAQGADVEQATMIEDLLSGVTYALADAGLGVFSDQGNKALDYIVASDGELLRRIGIMQGFSEYTDWYYCEYPYDNCETTFENSYLNVSYDNQTEYQYEKQKATFAVMDEVANVLNATVATLTEAQVTALVNLLAVIVPVDLLAEQTGAQASVITALKTDLTALIADQDANVLALIASLTSYVVTQDVFGALQTLTTTIYNHNVAEFGADYQNDIDYDGLYDMNAMIIFAAGHLDAWYTSTNATKLAAVIAAVFDYLASPNFLTVSGMTIDDVNGMETMITGMIDSVFTQVETIKTYNANSLTGPQQDAIYEFLGNFGFMG